MTIWAALFWGAFSSAALFLGQALAVPLRPRTRTTGLLMGFGAGTMLSAVAYELLPRSSLGVGYGLAVAALAGALMYYLGDRVIDGSGGSKRTSISGADENSSGMAMFLGALLDGLPEAFILGSGLAMGGGISVAFVVAVFVSNIPQGAAGTISLLQAGSSQRRVTALWGGLTLACALAAALGFQMAGQLPHQGVYTEAFAAGAVLVMLSDSMIPEAYQHGGRSVGILTVFGYLVAAALTVVG